MAENNLIKSYFEEEYGVRIQPVVDEYPLENYSQIKNDSFVRANSLLRDLPFFVTQFSAEQKVTGTYKVIFDRGLGTLQQSASNPDRLRANIVRFGSNNRIVGQAELEEFQLKVTTPALVLFEVAAIITNQYYLSRIDKKLASIHKELKNIERILENGKESELRSYEISLQSVFGNLSNIIVLDDDYRKSTLNNVQRIRMNSLSLVEYYYRERVDILHTWSKEKPKKALIIQAYIGRYQNALDLYCRSFHVFAFAYVLETLLSRITDANNLNRIISEIKDIYHEYGQEYEEHFSQFSSPETKNNGDIAICLGGFATGAFSAFMGISLLPFGGLMVGSGLIISAIQDKKNEKAVQQFKEIERCLKEIEDNYAHNNSVEEKSVFALETLNRLYNNKIEFLVKDDEMYMKV